MFVTQPRFEGRRPAGKQSALARRENKVRQRESGKKRMNYQRPRGDWDARNGKREKAATKPASQ